jgi:hypothetical protein
MISNLYPWHPIISGNSWNPMMNFSIQQEIQMMNLICARPWKIIHVPFLNLGKDYPLNFGLIPYPRPILFASFATADFTVTDGAVTVKNVNLGTQTTGDYVQNIQGTANEVTVSPTSGEGTTVTIGLPDDVSITNNLTVGGNLNVTGTINSVNTSEVNIVDNKVNLNSNATGTPVANAGIRVERGDSADVEILWNETSDNWTLTNNGTNYHAVARKYAENLANPDTLAALVVTHNLGSDDVTVQVFETAGLKALVETDVERTSVNTITLRFATAPASGAYRVVITG